MVEILDTTLRDGEQTAGVSFNASEKLAIATLLLDELKVDRIEVASARVSSGESEAFEKICSWASGRGCIERVEALGFIDDGVSVDWIADRGGKVINLLAKGSLRHLSKQLRKSPGEHIADIAGVLDKAFHRGLQANVYLEDWSNGIVDSPEYVFQLVDALKSLPIKRFMLPDTLGVLNPWTCEKYLLMMRERYPQLHLDFHSHNDYSLAVANSLVAARCGIDGLHATVNGLGERSGNASLAALVAALHDHTDAGCKVDEGSLLHVCRFVESVSGIRVPDNDPVIGENVFTQSSGVHADGDRKGDLYICKLQPQRFGRERQYALGKVSGKANIIKNLEMLGLHLSPDDIKRVTRRVVELGDKKQSLTPEDLPFIVAEVLKTPHGSGQETIQLVNYSLQLTRNMHPMASLKLRMDGAEYEASSVGDGQYDAFMKALWSLYDKLGKKHPVLSDYIVGIPPGGKTDAIVSTTIVWNMDGHEFKTRGLDPDQTVAAIKASLKMLNLIENFDIINLHR